MALPLWADCFNIGSMIEYFGIGVRGCKDNTPGWRTECLVEAIRSVVDDKNKEMHQRAAQLGREAQTAPGRHGAANIIATLARRGYA